MEEKKNQSPGDLRFFWISKTAQSLSLSNSEPKEKGSILSHVQRRVRLERRLKTLSNSTSKPSSADLPEKNRPAPSMVEPVDAQSHSNKVSTKSVNPLNTADELSRDLVVRLIYPTENCMDPFKSSAARLDQHAHDLIRYYINVGMPIAMCRRGAWGPRLRGPQIDSLRFIRGCITDELLMQSTLALTASRLENVEGVVVSGGTSAFIQTCLRSLRKALSAEATDCRGYAWVITRLCCSEQYRSNHEAALTHLRAAKRLINSLGGVEKLTVEERVRCLATDCFVACEQVSLPMFPRFHDLEQLGRDWGNNYLVLENHDRVGSGFLTPRYRAIINCGLADVIKEMADCTRLALGMCRTDKEIPYVVWRGYQLQTITLACQLLDKRPKDPRTEAMRLSLILFTAQGCLPAGPRGPSGGLVPQLREVLSKIDNLRWHEYSDLLIWILTIGVMSAEGCRHYEWFVECLNRWIVVHEIASETELRVFLEPFFYLDNMRLPSLIYPLQTSDMVREYSIRIA